MVQDDDIEGWVREYEATRETFHVFAREFKKLLEILCEDQDIFVHTVECRAKSIKSFRKKLVEKGQKYTDPLIDVTDLAGVRIITFFKDDVERISQSVQKEFNVDMHKSEWKKPKERELGYHSIQLITSLGSREKEFEYRKFAKKQCEIQIRTIGQHAWAAIDHAYVYKRKDNPYPEDIRRRLNLLSAMYEVCDNELLAIREMVSEHDVRAIKESSTSGPLNATTLRAYLDTEPHEYNNITRSFDEEGVIFIARRISSDVEFDKAVENLRKWRIDDVQSLREILKHGLSNNGKTTIVRHLKRENTLRVRQPDFLSLIVRMIIAEKAFE